ncbi:MAG: mannose-1-phosphate guanylyltransferase [Candidatus Omnitrophica bacterium]|nr:mannose-1-phosphate guanylyltransferase [Candidatus Omnitrophota bacterium]
MGNRVKGQGSRNKVYAVILVGGKGKRLKPLSTDAKPKAFLSVTKDNKTMFRRTVDRINKIIPPENIMVLASRNHSSVVRNNFPSLRADNLVLEPVSRNTAPAITLAASILKRRFGNAVMVVLPSDHYITSEKKYLAVLRKGIDFVKRNKDALVVLGLEPEYAATGFGYIKTKDQRPETRDRDISKVERFTEKPDLKTAKKFIKSKRYLWNSGMFIFKASTLLETVMRTAPGIFKGITKFEKEHLERSFRDLPDISIDYAVMEKARNVYCVKAAFGWHDIGNFDSLKEILRRESRSFVERKGKVVGIL